MIPLAPPLQEGMGEASLAPQDAAPAPPLQGGGGEGLPGTPGRSAFGCSGGQRRSSAVAAVATMTTDASESNQQSTNNAKWRGRGATGRRHDEGRGMHTTIKQIIGGGGGRRR